MRKGLIVLLAVVLAAAFAMPAVAADIKASGFYRSKAWLSNFHDGYSAPSLRTGDPGDEEQTNAFVEQRFRVKFDFGTENVKAVWYLESDMLWGDAAGSAKQFTTDTTGMGANRNTGGALGADRINTETKNIYVWFKVPDTSLDITVGLQNQSDDYAGILYGGADMAGIFLNGKYEPVSYKLGFAKLYENDPKKTDDMTLYTVAVNFVPTKDAKMGLMFYFLQDDSAKDNVVTFTSTVSGVPLPAAVGANKFARKVYMPGINGTFKAGPATISGFLQYQTGKDKSYNPAVADRDITAYMGDLRADMNVGPGKLFLEGLYLSGGDDPSTKYKAPITLATREASPGGNSAYSRTGMEILLASPDTINVSQCLIGCSGGESGSDPGNKGRGIWHLAAGYQMAFSPKVSGNFNIGYLAATKKTKADEAAGIKGTDMGTELNARVNYNIYKGLDVGLVAAYAFIGDFYNFTGSSDIKDAWTSNARINYSF
jgi:hypothetical protein